MNETDNQTEEDVSWINFRLTIQQVILLWCLTIQVFSIDFVQVYDAEAMWVSPGSFHCLIVIYSSLIICEYIPEYTLDNAFPTLWQSGVWATSWFWPPSSAPLRWGQQGTSWSGTWPCLTSACVLSPCPWLWWVRSEHFGQDMLMTLSRKCNLTSEWSPHRPIDKAEPTMSGKEDGHLLVALLW